MKLLTSFLVLTLLTSLSIASELEDISKQFVAAATKGDIEVVRNLYMDSPTKDKTVAGFSKALPSIRDKKILISHVSRELILGDLGVTLLKMNFEGHSEAQYKPMICVRTKDGWKIFPWSSDKDLKVLLDQRNQEEQIHLQLFNTWANLTKAQLTKLAEQDAAPNH